MTEAETVKVSQQSLKEAAQAGSTAVESQLTLGCAQYPVLQASCDARLIGDLLPSSTSLVPEEQSKPIVSVAERNGIC